MAQGVMVSCAQYYDDTTTYPGTAGSSTNPYAVEDCYDFCAISTPSSGSFNIHYQLVQNIDFNDHSTYKYGMDHVMMWNVGGGGYNGTLYVDGHGYSVRNLVCRNYTSTDPYWIGHSSQNAQLYIDNLDFVNFVLINCTTNMSYVDRFIRYTNCNFSIYLSNSTLTAICQSAQMISCTLNVSGTNYVYSSSGWYIAMLGYDNGTLNQYKQNCHFNFDNLIISPFSWGTSTQYIIGTASTGYTISLTNCYFTGSLSTGSTTTGSGATKLQIFKGCTVSNCYVAINITFTHAGSNASFYISDRNCSAISFVDTEIISGVSSISGTYNYLTLTDAQSKDPLYLQNAGFPVIPISSNS